MTDISLKLYLAQIETMIQSGSNNEAVYHCRHILQHFPKNVACYRLLGQALLRSSQWEGAAEAFRRVLSVFPDDDTAHFGLSRAYRRMSRVDDAIWHLERAYEQKPNNDVYANDLREMYLEHRGIENARLQLTTGAVAQQYARNGLYEQATDVLIKALNEQPRRVDLRLMLARIQWEAGQEVQAAEVAIEVIELLPDCRDANVILAQLWLAESRPSDAQRYLSRIEPVDPYLALQIAQGAPPAVKAHRTRIFDVTEPIRGGGGVLPACFRCVIRFRQFKGVFSGWCALCDLQG